MKQKSRLSALIIILAMFCLGALVGIGGTIYTLKSKREARVKLTHEQRQEQQVNRMETRLARMLDLSDAQRLAVREELKASASAFKRLNQELRPRFHALMKERTAAIETHLTPEQIERWKIHNHRRRLAERERRLQAGPGHPPPPPEGTLPAEGPPLPPAE